MRVLYVADSLMAGGIESQLVELATRLDRARFEPHLLCLYGPRVRGLHFAARIRESGIPLRTLDLDWTPAAKARGVAAIVAAAWALRPAIIQAEGYHANLLTRLARPLLPPVHLIGSLPGVPSNKQLVYERLSARLCSRIVVNAPHLARMLASGAGVSAARVVHIPNGIDCERFAPARPYDRNACRLRIHADHRAAPVREGGRCGRGPSSRDSNRRSPCAARPAPPFRTALG